MNISNALMLLSATSLNAMGFALARAPRHGWHIPVIAVLNTVALYIAYNVGKGRL